MDISDIELVFLWRANKLSMSSLWQRMGRGSRNLLREAIAVIFAESKTFDSVRAEKEEKKRKREETKAAKQAAKSVGSSGNTERPRKRQRTESEKRTARPNKILKRQ